jgi:hypothetical protein
MTNLPLLVQMQIDLTVQAHQREIAEGFAKLRAELLPESEPSHLDLLRNVYGSPRQAAYSAQLQAALMPSEESLRAGNLQSLNPYWNQPRPLQGLRQLLLGGFWG